MSVAPAGFAAGARRWSSLRLAVRAAVRGGEHVVLADPPGRPGAAHGPRSMPWAAATRRATGVAPQVVRRRGGTSVPGGTRRARRRGSGRAAVGRPAPAAMRAMTWPTETVSPAGTRISASVPEAGAGTSASTLSVGISTSVSSAAIGSPSALCPLEHGALADDRPSPAWRRRRCVPCRPPRPPPRRRLLAAAARRRRPSRSPRRRAPRRRPRVAVAASPPAAPFVGAISASTAPTTTVSPSAAWTFTIVPAIGAGTSASTLSVEISTSVSSAAMGHPPPCAIPGRCPR